MKVDVLNKGYVRLVNSMGTDIDVVRTARVSFDKETDANEDGSLSEKDAKLLTYLVKHKHDSCLRHNVMTFEVYAPLEVARQWYKHAVASAHWEEQSGWNESSRRYVTENVEFYIPDNFLSIPDNKKQGSGLPVDDDTNAIFRQKLLKFQEQGNVLYEEAMASGIAPEQARLFLPAYGMYVRWRWTASLNSVLNFISLRLDAHAQSEIQEYAKVVNDFVLSVYPVTHKAWMEHRVE